MWGQAWHPCPEWATADSYEISRGLPHSSPRLCKRMLGFGCHSSAQSSSSNSQHWNTEKLHGKHVQEAGHMPSSRTSSGAHDAASTHSCGSPCTKLSTSCTLSQFLYSDTHTHTCMSIVVCTSVQALPSSARRSTSSHQTTKAPGK